MAETINMRRRGLKLEGITPYDEELVAGFPEGKDLTVTITRQRSQRQHRFFFGLLNKVVENHDEYQRPDQLLMWLKIRLGYVEELRFHDDKVWWVTKSISFNSMPQDEFKQFFERALDLIVTEVIFGMDKTQLVHEVEQMLGFRLDEVWDKKHGVHT